MQPTTVLLNEVTQRNLQALAEQQGKTIDEIMQEAIQLYFVSVQKKQPKSIGIGKSNLTDLSERVDELLWQEP
jgi:predicted transcriptional regulator